MCLEELPGAFPREGGLWTPDKSVLQFRILREILSKSYHVIKWLNI